MAESPPELMKNVTPQNKEAQKLVNIKNKNKFMPKNIV